MKKIFLLSLEDIELAKEEIVSLLNAKFELIGNLMIIEDKSGIKLQERLGLTHKIFRYLFKCKKEEFLDKVMGYDWNKIYKGGLCVRVHSSEFKEREIAFEIYKRIKNPIVDLKNPKTKIEFFFYGNICVCGLFLSDIDKSCLERKAHLRPSIHPTSMNPMLAKACINITGLKKGKLIDPCAGSGGILIEAGLMGFKTEGYDLDKGQVERAKKNFKHYKIKCKMLQKDARLIDAKADAIVTDFPYGKSSKAKNIETLYYEILKNAENITNNAVVIFPSFADWKGDVLKTGWKISKQFSIYVHKSLTRIVLVLRKR